jgi:hypothetical protein
LKAFCLELSSMRLTSWIAKIASRGAGRAPDKLPQKS